MVAFVDHSASVLVVACARAQATPLIEHLFDQGLAADFCLPDDAAMHAGHRLAVLVDCDDDARLRAAARTLAPAMPCILVSDARAVESGVFRARLPGRCAPSAVVDAVRGLLTARAVRADLVGQAPCMQQARALIERVALKMTPVLLEGETGVGKQVAAREIHRRSARTGAFVVLDCAGIADAHADETLFGAAGAPMNAGALEAARGGTLLLDDVAGMSSLIQARLARLLDSGVYRRAGDTRERSLDVRVIATCRDCLERAVAAGRLRSDLFYRLSVFPIRLPPLRERIEDIPALIDALAADLCVAPPRLDAAAVRRLGVHNWPGNVRELAGLIERLAIISAHAPVDVATLNRHLGAPGVAPGHAVPGRGAHPEAQITMMTLPDDGIDLRALVERMEKQLIEQALERHAHVVAHAARALGLRRTTLTEKLRRYAIGAN